VHRLWTAIDSAAPRRLTSRGAYLEAVGVSVLGVCLSVGIALVSRVHLPFIFGLAAVLFTALRPGFAPAVTATVIGLIGTVYFGPVSPVVTPTNVTTIALFSLATAVAGEALLRLRARADAYAWQLSQRKAYLQSVFATSPAAMLVIAHDDKILTCNQAAATLFDYTSEELAGEPINRLIALRRDHRAIDELATAIARYRLSGDLAIGIRRNGSPFEIALSMAEISVGAQQLITLYVRDESLTRKAALDYAELQMEVQQMSRATALGQLGSAIAHELNQPLASAANYAGAARRLLVGGQPVGKVDALVSESIGQIFRASAILKSLRQFVGSAEHEAQWIDVRQVISEAAHLVQLPVRHAGVVLGIEIASDVEYVMVDRVQIQQVLLNLIVNATQAMTDCTERHLQLAVVRGDHDLAIVMLTDSGPGIAPLARDHLFKPFSSTKHNGLGVGLAISRSIVEAHGGRLWLDESVARGTRFCFTLRHRDAIDVSDAA